MRDDEADFTQEAEAAGRTEEESPATRRASTRRTTREPGRGATSEPERESTAASTLASAPRTSADLGELEAPRDDISEDEIRERAYELYRMRGGLDGFDQADWYAAEQEIRGRRHAPRSPGSER